MPLPFFILLAIAIGAAGAAVSVVISFWDRILGWAQTGFLPWVDKHLPEFSGDARRAFMSLHGVVADVRRTIRDAWRALRTRLVAQIVEFSRDVNSRWVVRTVSWAIASLSPQEDPQVVQYREERIVPIEDLPAEVVKRWMEQNESTISFDLTKVRDEEFMDMRMEG
ncbi:hypothetical protein HRW07_02725 [Streptomyces lunaelactis]|uniref:hypothetical protein n=1 Tax=Streptomyces lunaelactis TaxID=1535768 RepID=UPI001585A6BB|nr:hypothetical protein [Streptomyces lunaelactis]NUL02175.1 hypothetical protein [Streptomyces lunaelactis]